MPGYEWKTQVRIVPQNGLEETIVFATAFSDAGGPVRVDLRYEEVIVEREDVNRVLRPLRLGFRVSPDFTFDIVTTVDQANLAKIANRLMSPDFNLFLSLDAGVVEREIEMTRAPSPDPLGGKTANGARFRLGTECIELIDEIPDIGTGSW